MYCLISKFQSSKNLLGKLKFFSNWPSLWIELLQNFIYQITCLKNSNCWRFDSVQKQTWFFIQKFWNSHSLFKNLKLFWNWFRLWNHLECFILWIACRKNSNFSKAMQYIEGIQIFQCPKAQNGCWKNSKFSRTKSV